MCQNVVLPLITGTPTSPGTDGRHVKTSIDKVSAVQRFSLLWKLPKPQNQLPSMAIPITMATAITIENPGTLAGLTSAKLLRQQCGKKPG
jgi:hypothetical protein